MESIPLIRIAREVIPTSIPLNIIRTLLHKAQPILTNTNPMNTEKRGSARLK